MSAYTDGLTCRSTVGGGNDVHAAVHLIELLLHVLEVHGNLSGLGHVWPLPWWVVWWPRHQGCRIVGHVYRWSDDDAHVWHRVWLGPPCVGEWLAFWWRQRRREWLYSRCIPCDRECTCGVHPWHCGGCWVIAMFGEPRPAVVTQWRAPAIPGVP